MARLPQEQIDRWLAANPHPEPSPDVIAAASRALAIAVRSAAANAARRTSSGGEA